MTIHNQLELFPEGQPESALEIIERRLPRSDWVRVSDVALALDVCTNTVYGWCEGGMLTVFKGASNGRPDRSTFRVFRPSVIRYAKVCLGIEPPEKGKNVQ